MPPCARPPPNPNARRRGKAGNPGPEQVPPQPHHLFCLFYQVEIRYRQLPKANRPIVGPICTEVPRDYGIRMVG